MTSSIVSFGLRSKICILYVLLALNVSYGVARTFTVTNNCPFTIWPALFTDLNVAKNVPNQSTGWEAPASSSVSFFVPDNWKAGRIWGRRNCNFSGNSGPNSCATGGCNGGLLCDPHTGTGVPPVTLAEWTLQGSGYQDFYDVSLVDGVDLPLRIDNNVGCPVAECPVDLGPNCPGPLRGPTDSSGFVLGCKSACDANLDGNPANSPNCCSGNYSTPQTCPASGVADYWYFKGSCLNAYAYAFDESSGTALWTCNSSLNADYTVTFCPYTQSNASTSSTARESDARATGSTPSSTSSALRSSSGNAQIFPSLPGLFTTLGAALLII